MEVARCQSVCKIETLIKFYHNEVFWKFNWTIRFGAFELFALLNGLTLKGLLSQISDILQEENLIILKYMFEGPATDIQKIVNFNSANLQWSRSFWVPIFIYLFVLERLHRTKRTPFQIWVWSTHWVRQHTHSRATPVEHCGCRNSFCTFLILIYKINWNIAF